MLIIEKVLRGKFILVLLIYALCQTVLLVMFDNQVAGHQPLGKRDQRITTTLITYGSISTFQRINQVVIALNVSFAEGDIESLQMFLIGQVG